MADRGARTPEVSGPVTLARGTWADAEALIGKVIARTEGVDCVTAADIRRRLEALCWDEPLHYDDDLARRHGYRAAVSPVTMARAWAMPAYWSPGEPRIGSEQLTTPLAAAAVPGEGDTMIATAVRTRYGAAVHPGDRISSSAVLRSVTQKRTRLGPGAFIVVETTYSNQDGETVAVESTTLFRYRSEVGKV